MLRIAIMIVLAAHGLMHILGALWSWSTLQTGWSLTAPWAFSAGVTLRSPIGKLTGLIWLAALAMLLTGTFGMWANREWFRAALATGAALSVVAVMPWGNAIPEVERFWILAIDVLIMIVLCFRWQFNFNL